MDIPDKCLMQGRVTHPRVAGVLEIREEIREEDFLIPVVMEGEADVGMVEEVGVEGVVEVEVEEVVILVEVEVEEAVIRADMAILELEELGLPLAHRHLEGVNRDN